VSLSEEQVVRVTIPLSEYKGYLRYIQRKRLGEVRRVLREIESMSQDKKDKKAPSVDASEWLQDWKIRRAKEESDKLEQQIRERTMSPEERLAEVNQVLRAIEKEAAKG
jgi:hypothetical protein